MASRSIRTLLSAGAQAVAQQVLAVFFFYLLSIHLSKDEFGIISWCNAVAFVVTIVLSMGLEQVVLRRVAAGGSRSDWTAGAYFLHALGTGVITALLLSAGSLAFPEESKARLLPMFFVAQGILAAAVPLRVLLNAKERFAPYAVAALVSNGVKIAAALLCVANELLSVRVVGAVLIGTAIIECGVAAAVAFRSGGLTLRVPRRGYRALLRDALPQYAVVLFDVGLARTDWVLMGLLSTNAATADYAFAYRAFELARIPINVLGSLLMPKAARALDRTGTLQPAHAESLKTLFTVTLSVAILAAALLNTVWAPAIDVLTGGAYGTPTRGIVALLSGCIPLSYAVTMLWTLCFAARRLKSTARITAAVAVINVATNVALIPVLGGTGAAAAFLGTIVVQAALYMRLARRVDFHLPAAPLLGMAALAAGLLLLCRWLDLPPLLEALILVAGYSLVGAAAGPLQPAKVRSVLSSLRR